MPHAVLSLFLLSALAAAEPIPRRACASAPSSDPADGRACAASPPPPHAAARSAAAAARLPLLAVRAGGAADADGRNDGEPELENSALVFVKPHADSAAVRDYVRSALLDRIPGVRISDEFEISGAEIDRKKLIDGHYYAIASKATMLGPGDMGVPADKFEDFFGEPWSEVLSEGRAANAVEACERFGCDAAALSDAWREAESKSKVAKLGGGFYCGLLAVGSEPPLYVFNAFFMSMRAKYVDPDSSIYCYKIEWDASDLPWEKFRASVLGPTDPSSAPRGSIRRTILDRYRDFGLSAPPNKGDNGVHGSASPFEGLVEKVNWCGDRFGSDDFGGALLRRGVPERQLVEWSKDPRVTLPDGSVGSLFDALEDLDAQECLERLWGIYSAS